MRPDCPHCGVIRWKCGTTDLLAEWLAFAAKNLDCINLEEGRCLINVGSHEEPAWEITGFIGLRPSALECIRAALAEKGT